MSKKVHISKTAVHQAVSKFNISGKYTDLKRSYRTRKTTVRDMIMLSEGWTPNNFKRHPTTSSNKIRLSLTERGTYVSRSTISRHLMKDFRYYPINLQGNLDLPGV